MSLKTLESRLCYTFTQSELLRQALTHRSHSASNNERLEFLGDSVLNCSVAALLFRRFPGLDEGDLSRLRSNLVKQQALFELSLTLGLAEFIVLGEGELKSGGKRRPSILADTVEAVLGAIFVDGGFEAAEAAIERLYQPLVQHIDPLTLGKDAKTLLQEYLQASQTALPQYTVVATHGAAHSQQFDVECQVPKFDIRVTGSGASRRAAEQIAAVRALEILHAVAPVPDKRQAKRAGRHSRAVSSAASAANSRPLEPELFDDLLPTPAAEAGERRPRALPRAVEVTRGASRGPRKSLRTGRAGKTSDSAPAGGAADNSKQGGDQAAANDMGAAAGDEKTR